MNLLQAKCAHLLRQEQKQEQIILSCKNERKIAKKKKQRESKLKTEFCKQRIFYSGFLRVHDDTQDAFVLQLLYLYRYLRRDT